jgi:hypothetical protein
LKASEVTRSPASRAEGLFVLVLLGASAAALGLAPLALTEPSYSWVANTTSESAAQGAQGAWVARLAFLLLGLGVLFLSQASRERWVPLGRLLLGSFGVLMIGVAAFSHRHWLPEVPYDQTEDIVHSVAASAAGLAFALGVLVVSAKRVAITRWQRGFDLFAVTASVLIPLTMSQMADYSGLLQRAMFLTAYVWFGNEALHLGSVVFGAATAKVSGDG